MVISSYVWCELQTSEYTNLISSSDELILPLFVSIMFCLKKRHVFIVAKDGHLTGYLGPVAGNPVSGSMIDFLAGLARYSVSDLTPDIRSILLFVYT